MRILIVDESNAQHQHLYEALISLGHDVMLVDDREALLRRIEVDEVQMVFVVEAFSGFDATGICREIRELFASRYVYLVIVSKDVASQEAVDGLAAGADDLLPFKFTLRELAARLQVAERLLSLETYETTLFGLAKLAESRDPETGEHLDRMRQYCRALASQLRTKPHYAAQMGRDFARLIYLTSPLHDIGKVGIPDHVLLKPGRLTPDEFEMMKQHARIGGETLEALVAIEPGSQPLQMACEIAWTHHEKWDGSGYPRKLAGEAIPLSGRIVAIADVYDALTSARIYKAAMTHDEAREIIVAGRGSHFDPELVDAFLEIEEEFLAIKSRFDQPLEVAPEPTWPEGVRIDSGTQAIPKAVPKAVPKIPARATRGSYSSTAATVAATRSRELTTPTGT